MDDNTGEGATGEGATEKKRKRSAPKKDKAKAKKVRKAKASNGTTKSVVDLSRYSYEKAADAKTPSGRACVDNADGIAEALRGKSVEDIEAIFAKNKIGDSFKPSWRKLNPGLARMSAGNVLRGIVRKGTPIKVGSETVKAL